MKNDQNNDDESIVEGVVDDVLPGLGKLVKKLRKNSPELNRKILEKDAEIKKRLEEGYSPEPKIQYNVRVRTLAPERKETAYKPHKVEKAEKKTIEPVVDFFDEGTTLRVIAEMPGIDEEQIVLDLQESTLFISASDKRRTFQKEVLLPCEARLLKQRFQNGILELTLEKV
jgi:HSP20 family protein